MKKKILEGLTEIEEKKAHSMSNKGQQGRWSNLEESLEGSLGSQKSQAQRLET